MYSLLRNAGTSLGFGIGTIVGEQEVMTIKNERTVPVSPSAKNGSGISVCKAFACEIFKSRTRGSAAGGSSRGSNSSFWLTRRSFSGEGKKENTARHKHGFFFLTDDGDDARHPVHGAYDLRWSNCPTIAPGGFRFQTTITSSYTQ